MLYHCLPRFPSLSLSLSLHRYLQGWQELTSADMNSFFRQLAAPNWEAIRHMEPFDEYEEWHLKCGHYLLVCATVGNSSALQPALRLSVRQPRTTAPVKALDGLPVWEGVVRRGNHCLRR